MKKFLLLVVVGIGTTWCYFWYVRGENLLDLLSREQKGLAAPAYSVTVSEPGRWESAAPMPAVRTNVGAAALGGKIYVVGGQDGFTRTVATVFAFDIAKNEWTEVAPLPKPLHSAAVGSDGKRLFVFGGVRGLAQTPIDSMFIYDPATGAWTSGPELNDPVGAAAVTFLEGKFHLMGGQGLGRSTQSHYAFDPITSAWSTEETLVSGRDHFGAASIGDRIYIVGGRAGSVVYNMDDNETYDLSGKQWEQREHLPAKRSSHGVVTIGGKLYVFGGEAPTLSFADVYEYDPKTDRWRVSIQMPGPRQGFGYAAAGGKIFVFGGGRRAGFSVSNLTEVFTPLP